jgi:hypothetical protein
MVFDFVRFGEDLLAGFRFVNSIFRDDVEADLDALVADIHGGPGNQFPHLMLALAAKAATQHVTVALGHQILLPPLYNKCRLELFKIPLYSLETMILSMRP